MKFFDKFKRVTNPRTRVVAADMNRLNKVQHGLGDKAVGYIMNGENESVLSTLASCCDGTELEVCSLYLKIDSPAWPRRQLLAQDYPYDVDLARRYTNVLTATCNDLPDCASGSAKTFSLVRVFFSEAFSGMSRNINGWPPEPVKINSKGLTLETAEKMTTALCGTIVDLIDVLYYEKGMYTSITADLYHKAVDVKPLAKRCTAEFIEAGRRINSRSGVKMIEDLHSFKLADTPEYRDFILELAGDSSKAVREMVLSVLNVFDAKPLEPKAIHLLEKGSLAMRAGMVSVLAKIETESAVDALRNHREKEKAARIISAIDAALTVSKRSQANTSVDDNNRQYEAMDGSIVEIPTLLPLPDSQLPQFDQEDRNILLKSIREENARIEKQNEESKRQGYIHGIQLVPEHLAGHALNLFNSDLLHQGGFNPQLNKFLAWGPGRRWTKSALSRLPKKNALCIAIVVSHNSAHALSLHGKGPFNDVIKEYINGPNGDLCHIEALESEMKKKTSFGYGIDQFTRHVEPGDFLRRAIQVGYLSMETVFHNVPIDVLWPYLAQNLDVFDEAFGLSPLKDVKLSRVAAIRMLYRLPKTPARFFGQLLETATGDTKGGRAEARKMLSCAPDVEQHVLAQLQHSRQAVRASAAEWIADRNNVNAIPELKGHLKKEKSELVKAAILTTLDTFGEDLSGFVGQKALLEEAEAGLKKAKLEKLDWLNLDRLPKVRFRSGRQVPVDVLRWWFFLAVKFKQPGGNTLIDIYLERLKPEDTKSLSTWILDSWYNHDTARPSEQEANAYATQNAASHYNQVKGRNKDYTEDRAYQDLKLEFLSNYLNSGAATRGLLALCKHTPATFAADRVRTYLKNHGSRTSQASALLELLTSMDSTVTIQVVISAATRLKQKGLQKFAGSLLEKFAEAKSWSFDELADRTIPSAGLGEDGILHLLCGLNEKIYSVTIGVALTLEIRNPDGKVVKSLPSGQDDVTKNSKKQLSASRRELNQVIAMQSARFYEALCSERIWAIDDWKRDISAHPIMRKLAERAVWLGLNSDGEIIGAFRPTARGDYSSISDEDIYIDVFSSVRLAHSALISEWETAAWQSHLKDYEVDPIVTQFGRALLTIEKDQESSMVLDDRRGWATDTFTIRGAASKLGYERGKAMDMYFNEYLKDFKSTGLLAVIEFSGNCLPEQNVPAAMISLRFERYAGGVRAGGAVKLSDVPPVLLSECWHDYRFMVAKAAFDENWEQKMPWM